MINTKLKELSDRGLIQDTTDLELLKMLSLGSAFYVGFDPTAPYLQLGNLLPIIVSLHLAQTSLKPIILFGGATGSIGDPSGKSKERVLLDQDIITSNINEQKKQVIEIFRRCDVSPTFVNNYDWTYDVSILEFLRDIGKFFTVNHMLAKDSVRLRLEGNGISFTEFSYMLLQAYDFYHLYTNHNCLLQIGGADQWGNITAGLELIRKKANSSAYGLSIPLITDSTGAKFGKSSTGTAIWLDERGTSPYTLHQFFLNTTDEDAIRYLKLLTFISLDEIDEIGKKMYHHPESRDAQKILANVLCTLIHGKDKTEEAIRGASVLFSKSTDANTTTEVEAVLNDIPGTDLSLDRVKSMNIIDLLETVKLVNSRAEAKKLIKNGGVYLNNKRVDDIQYPLSSEITEGSKKLLLRIGKKRYHAVRLLYV